VKNKRSKSSIFFNSTKNKTRKQVKSEHSQKFYVKETAHLGKNATFGQAEPHFRYKNIGSSYRNSTPTAVGPFFVDGDDSAYISDDGPTRPDFTYKKDKPKRTYIYGFTDSKFIHFLGHLTPKEYLLFVTIVGLLIVEDRNETEAKILYAFISNVADTMQTIVEQEVILSKYKHNNEAFLLNNALHQDFEIIYAELARIKKKLPK